MSLARRKSVTSAAFSIAGRLAGEAATAVAVGADTEAGLTVVVAMAEVDTRAAGVTVAGATVVETTAAVVMVGAANLCGHWKRECTRLTGRRRPLGT